MFLILVKKGPEQRCFDGAASLAIVSSWFLNREMMWWIYPGDPTKPGCFRHLYGGFFDETVSKGIVEKTFFTAHIAFARAYCIHNISFSKGLPSRLHHSSATESPMLSGMHFAWPNRKKHQGRGQVLFSPSANERKVLVVEDSNTWVSSHCACDRMRLHCNGRTVSEEGLSF